MAGAGFCPTCGQPLAARPDTGMPSTAGVGEAESRNWAMGSHLTALAGAFVGGVASFVGPLVIWLLRKDSDPFAAGHALEALNFNLTIIILAIAAVVLGVATLGIGLLLIVPVGIVVGIVWLVWTIQAAMAASRGEPYRYPVSIRMVS
jgi:uncharacterized protein